MDKRGQITVFMIIGILALLIFAGVLYVSNKMVREEITAEGEPVIEEVPSEFAPLQSFTENCLASVGKKGLLILGQQGGYIYPELLGEFSSAKPTEGAGLNLEPMEVPYWYYNTEPNEGEKISLANGQPKLYYPEDKEMSVEAQLGRFVREKLGECLGDYTAFKEQGFEVSQGEAEVEAKVGEQTVNFWLKMKVEAKKGGATGEMEQFYVKIPLKLKHYYEIADKITGAEKEYKFLEKNGLNLITIFSGVDRRKLPPTSMTTFEMAPTAYWNELEVKENVKKVLASYVPMMRFLGSENFYDYVYPESRYRDLYQATSDQMVLTLGGAEDLEVSFDYFGWEPYFKTNSAGGMIKPYHTFTSYKGLVNLGMQIYDTRYDLSYPVLVTLRDKEALNGEGYTFNFALEANIRNNEAVEDKQVKEVYPAKISRSACEEEQKDAGPLKTVVVDSFTKEPIELVRVGFTIPHQDECEMGFTDFKGELESKYPAAYGGVVNFIKEDYLTSFYPIDTEKYMERPGMIGYAVEGLASQVVELDKKQTIKVGVKKKNLEKCIGGSCISSGVLGGGGKEVYSYTPQFLESKHSWIFRGVSKPLSGDEQAVITLERVKDLNEKVRGSEFTQMVSLKGGEEKEIELVPGVYKVSGMVTLNKEVVIPGEERCTGGIMEAIACWDIDGCCFTFNETRMEKYLSGQVNWEEEETYWKITPEELYPAEKVTFYVLNQNILGVPAKAHQRVIEDLQVMGQLGNISSQPEIRRGLEPRFS